LDPQNQETQILLRRAEFMLKKLEEKYAIDAELEKKRKIEVELQERNKEMEVFKNMTHCSPPSKNCTRMIIEEVEDLKIDETSKLQESQLTIENSIASNKFSPKFIQNETIVPKFDKEKSKPPKTFNWPHRPHKRSLQYKNSDKIDETSAKLKEDNQTCKNVTQDILKNEENLRNRNATIDTIDNHHYEKLDNNVDDGDSIYSRLSNVHVPPEIIEAIQTQESIPPDHVAFGQATNKHQQSPVCTPYSKVEKNPKLKASNDMLAEEWRLNGNSYFSEGKFHNAVECYTTSLKYQER